MAVNPNPKPARLKLSKKKYRELRVALYSVYGEACPKCRLYRDLDQLHLHHTKTRGAGGDDKLSNLDWICWECHREGP